LAAAIDQPARGVAVARVHVEIGAEDPVVFRQMRREHRRCVDDTGAPPMTLHFLQRDDVGVRDFASDAREVVSVVRCRDRIGCCR
jgi:hypothetical protein